MSGNLAAWLLPHRQESGPIVSAAEPYRRATALAKELGVRWPQNVLRHSFISYRLALIKNVQQVALEAGNSPAIIFKHYRELTTEDQAQEWFGILPER